LDDRRCRSVLSLFATTDENTFGNEIREIRTRVDARRKVHEVFKGTREAEEGEEQKKKRLVLNQERVEKRERESIDLFDDDDPRARLKRERISPS